MNTTERKTLLAAFCEDANSPVMQLKLYSSFRKYSQAFDELAQHYSEKTGIPVEEFVQADLRRRATLLGG